MCLVIILSASLTEYQTRIRRVLPAPGSTARCRSSASRPSSCRPRRQRRSPTSSRPARPDAKEMARCTRRRDPKGCDDSLNPVLADELKKRIIRTLINEIVVDVNHPRATVEMQIHWAGGVTGVSVVRTMIRKQLLPARQARKNFVELDEQIGEPKKTRESPATTQ